MPLDHFDPGDPRTIDVVFAVLPATGESKGLFVTATGGPGTAGISSADDYTSYFAPSITRRFDIVFFDQRGHRPLRGADVPRRVRRLPPDGRAAGRRRVTLQPRLRRGDGLPVAPPVRRDGSGRGGPRGLSSGRRIPACVALRRELRDAVRSGVRGGTRCGPRGAPPRRNGRPDAQRARLLGRSGGGVRADPAPDARLVRPPAPLPGGRGPQRRRRLRRPRGATRRIGAQRAVPPADGRFRPATAYARLSRDARIRPALRGRRPHAAPAGNRRGWSWRSRPVAAPRVREPLRRSRDSRTGHRSDVLGRDVLRRRLSGLLVLLRHAERTGRPVSRGGSRRRRRASSRRLGGLPLRLALRVLARHAGGDRAAGASPRRGRADARAGVDGRSDHAPRDG